MAPRSPSSSSSPVAVGLQYFQMAQINNRNRKTGQPMPSQQQAMQRIPADYFCILLHGHPRGRCAVHDYFYSIRIITQDIMFRTGCLEPAQERASRPSPRRVASMPRAEVVETQAETLKSTPLSRARSPQRAALRRAPRTSLGPATQTAERNLAHERSERERRVNPWNG